MTATWTGLVLFSLACLTGGASLFAQTAALEVVGTIPGPADMVRVSGSYAFIISGANFRVVDISQPLTPKPRGSVQLPAATTAIAVSESAVYATLGLKGMAVVDVRNADALVVAGVYKTSGEALRIAAAGPRVVLTDRMAGADVIDVSRPAKPSSVGAYFTDGYTRDVAIAGSFAFIVDSTNDFAIVDLSAAGEPRALSNQSSSATTTLIALSSPATGARTAYLVGAGTLQVYDVSNPAAPLKLTTTKIHERTTALVVEGGRAYAAVGVEGLQVLDVSNPANPVVAGSYKTSGAARDVAVSNDLVFVVAGAGAASRVDILRARR